MRIDALYLNHFGCFHRTEMHPNPGINVIYGENETGKSTIHQFIQAMLFGVERLRGKGSKNDEYSRFQPWESGRNYEGMMEIEHEGEKYRLIRNFYKEDEFFRIEQLRTGREIHLPGNQIDGLIDGLNRGNFKNTLSIRQMESQVDARFGLSLQAYMANVQRTKSQDVNLEKTFEYLNKEKKACVDRDAEKHLQDLQAQVKALKVTESERKRLLEDIEDQKKQLAEVREKMEEERLAGRENRKKEQKERMEAIRLIEENNSIASQYRKKKAAYEKMKKQVSDDDFDIMKEGWEVANEEYEELSDRYDQLMGRNLAILFSVMIFGLIPVVVIFFLKNNVVIRAGVIILFAALLAAVAVLLQRGRRRMGKKVRASKEKLDRIHDQMEQHMFGRGNKESLKQLKEEMQFLREKYEQIQIPLQPYLEKYGEDIALDMDDTFDEDAVTFLRQKEESLMKSLERLLMQKETMEQKDVDRENLEAEIDEVSRDIDNGRQQSDVIDECMQIIRELSGEIHSDFGPALNREVSGMIWELTGGKYGRVVVDHELNLRIDTGAGFVDAEQLSTGTREQLYLALRLAMIKLLFPKKNMPVLFDDSFVFYDDKRLAQTLSWISNQGFEQVFIFTCQHREMDALEKMGINYTPIYLQ